METATAGAPPLATARVATTLDRGALLLERAEWQEPSGYIRTLHSLSGPYSTPKSASHPDRV